MGTHCRGAAHRQGRRISAICSVWEKIMKDQGALKLRVGPNPPLQLPTRVKYWSHFPHSGKRSQRLSDNESIWSNAFGAKFKNSAKFRMSLLVQKEREVPSGKEYPLEGWAEMCGQAGGPQIAWWQRSLVPSQSQKTVKSLCH